MHPMIKAVAKTGVSVVGSMLSLLPLRNTILFESQPDYACNTYPVFLQLRKELPDYKMVWCVAPGKEPPEGVDDTFIYESRKLFRWLKGKYYLHTAKAIVSCNRAIHKPRKEQVHLFLCHGSKTKKTRGLYEPGKGVDYINVQSHFFDDIIIYEYNCEKENLVYLGYPRCDWFFEAQEKIPVLKQKMQLPEDCKFLVWLPTFRKHKAGGGGREMDTSKYASIGMPLVYSLEELRELNDFLAQRNLYLIYKPHPAQNVQGLQDAKLEHIRIINDAYLAQRDLQLNQLLAASDGMITDYSSVFFDYLLTDKPILTTVDDIAEWKKMTGFAFDLDALLDQATTRVADRTALMDALEDVHLGRDSKAEGRAAVRELTNTYYDGDSAKRVSAFIREKIGEGTA